MWLLAKCDPLPTIQTEWSLHDLLTAAVALEAWQILSTPPSSK